MIKGLVVTGISGKEKRLRKALEILGDDTWGEDNIINFVKTFGCGIQYDRITNSYIRYKGESGLSSKDLTFVTYKELKALDKAFMEAKENSHAGKVFIDRVLRKKIEKEGYIFLGLNSKEWIKANYLNLNMFINYKIINKKHEEVLDHFLNGGDVERFNTISEEWELIRRDLFIRFYKETFDYRIHKKTPIFKKVKMIDVLKMCLEGKTVKTESHSYHIEDDTLYLTIKDSFHGTYLTEIEISELNEEVEILDDIETS